MSDFKQRTCPHGCHRGPWCSQQLPSRGFSPHVSTSSTKRPFGVCSSLLCMGLACRHLILLLNEMCLWNVASTGLEPGPVCREAKLQFLNSRQCKRGPFRRGFRAPEFSSAGFGFWAFQPFVPAVYTEGMYSKGKRSCRSCLKIIVLFSCIEFLDRGNSINRIEFLISILFASIHQYSSIIQNKLNPFCPSLVLFL